MAKVKTKVTIRLRDEDKKEFLRFLSFIRTLNRLNKREQQKIAGAVSKGFSDNFKNQANEFGPWAPSSKNSILAKGKAGYGGKGLLIRTGEYKNSFLYRTSSDHIEDSHIGPHNILIEVGSKHKLTPLHEGGSSSKIPKREVLPLTSQSESFLADIIDQVVNARAASRGF